MRIRFVGALVALIFFNSLGTAVAHTIEERKRDLRVELSKKFDPKWITDIFNHQNLCEGRAVENPGLKSWNALENSVMSDVSLLRGEMFFRSNETRFRKVASIHKDDAFLPFILLAILRIESNLGENRAGEPVIAILFEKYRKVVDGPSGNTRRANIVSKEIVPFLSMASTNSWDVCGVLGSRAAAFGYPHFIPESIRLAVDGDGDGKIDLMWNLDDALASVANYLSRVGWGKTDASRITAVFNYNPLKALRDRKADHRYVQIVFRYARKLQEKIDRPSATRAGSFYFLATTFFPASTIDFTSIL
jgi:membrane-bound lytic murein transglycosylase B